MKGAAKPGSNAALLIFIIGLSIVVYSLLYEDTITPADELANESLELEKHTYLLREHVGYLSGEEKDEEIYELPSVTLYTAKTAALFQQVPYIEVKDSLFGETIYELDFEIDDLNIVKNIYLSFNVDEYGKNNVLLIYLNGVEVYHDTVITNMNVQLNRLNLRQGTNTIKIKAGDSIFRNRFIIKDTEVVGDIYDVTKNKAYMEFTAHDEEIKDFKNAALSFYVDCLEKDVGKLKVYINNDMIYDALPDCNIWNRHITIPVDDFKDGNNVLRFENEYGSYILDDIQIEAEYLIPREPVYYFSAEEKDLTVNKDIELNFRFVDREDKDALLFVNDHPLVLSTDELSYTFDITDFVEEGYNSIKIEATESMNIAEINVEVLQS